MKNIISSFLIISLCIVFFCACSAKQSTPTPPTDSLVTENSPQQSTDAGVNKPIQTPAVSDTASPLVTIRISVNPEIALFVTPDGIVQHIQCLNKDAETVCDELALEGLTYEAAFSLLVKRINDLGYMSGREITIQVELPVELGADVPAWENNTWQAWISALQQHDLSCRFTILLDVDQPQEAEDPGINDTNDPNQEPPRDDEPYGQVTRDSQGNIIMTVEKDPDGNTITAYYDQYPQAKEVMISLLGGGSEQYFYNPDGSLQRLIFIDPYGVTVEQHYQNNVLTLEIIDGGAVERTYKNGVLHYEIHHLGDSQQERFYNTQGILESFIEITPTVTLTENYHPDGWLQRARYERTDGFTEIIYQGDGVILSEENSALNTKFTYDAAGNLVEAYGPDNYGKQSHVFFLADRTTVSYCYEWDGSITKSVQAPNNGSILSEIENYTGPITADIGTLVPPNGGQP